MKTRLHKGSERGDGSIGWLQSRFSFSFASYHNPERMGFGVLRVLNDDVIAGGGGFGMHPHDNMEIISIVTDGALRHSDSMGNEEVVKVGDIQVMSAGSGVYHSEMNNSDTHSAALFQIWITPKERNITPRHKTLPYVLEQNALTPLVSGDAAKTPFYIHQDAVLLLGKFDADATTSYKPSQGNGIFVLVIEGELTIGEHVLTSRDSLEITEADTITLQFTKDTFVLVIEVPMK